MKSQQKIQIKTITALMFAVTFFIMVSCNSQEKKQEADHTTVSQKTVKPPSVDIHTATFLGNLEVVRQHIHAGTDLNIKDAYGSSPLTIATTFGKTDVAKALIKAGADIHITSADGSTPLHTAAFFCRTEIVKALLAKGADKSLTNSYGSTALESVSGPFNEVKGIYDQISKDLGPLGFKLDYKHLETTRPVIAKMLQ